MTRLLGIVGVIMLLLGCCSTAVALTNEDIYAQFQFNFITPGARATAMGGAFIGLADDATAAVTNPAGLTALIDPEVSVEFKYLSYTAEQLFENPYDSNNWTYTDTRKMEFDDSVNSLPFVSAVYPLKRFFIALYRQELANYKSSYRTGAYPIAMTNSGGYWNPRDAAVELKVVNYGIGAAVEILDGLSLAVSPRWSQMDMTSHYAVFYLDDETGATDFSSNDLAFESRVDDSDEGFSLNIGLQWQPHPKFSFGAVYRSGTTFTVTVQPGRRGRYSVLDPTDDDYDSDLAEFTLRLPDSFGAGIAFRPSDTLTLTLDVMHVRYKDLLEDLDILYETDYLTADNFTVDNATEIHFGLEYLLVVAERIVTLRAGVYDDPAHAIRFTGAAQPGVSSSFVTNAYRNRFAGGEDQVHVTGGLGIVFNEHLQIDAATDIADNLKQVSVSAVYRF